MDKHEMELIVAAVLAAGSFGGGGIVSPRDMVQHFGKVRDELRQQKALSPARTAFDSLDIIAVKTAESDVRPQQT